MPAYCTHYLFGRINYKRLEEGILKRVIAAHKEVYALGLAGPDIFFYFYPDQILVRPTPGTILNEQACGAFLRRMLSEALEFKGEEREVALAYLAGFIGHYELDSSCHPCVYRYVEQEAKRRGATSQHEKTGIHFQYECAMDFYFQQHYTKKSAAILNQRRLTKLNKMERKVVGRLVAVSYNKTYPKPNLSEHSMRAVFIFTGIVMWLVVDREGKKERRMQAVERRLYGHPFLCGLYVNDNCYGINLKEWQEMNQLFQKGVRECGKTYCTLEQLLSTLNEGGKKEAEARKNFYHQLGSRSYHTGEVVD